MPNGKDLETSSVFQNASWSGLSTAFRAAAGLCNAFFAVRLLGTEQYGNVATILSLFALYLSLNVNIFTVVVTRLLALRAGNLFQEMVDELSTSTMLFVLCSIGLLFLVFAPLVSVSSAAVLSSKGNAFQIFYSIWGIVYMMALLTALQILTACNSAFLEGVGRLDIAMKCQFPGTTVILLLLAVMYAVKPQVTAIEYLAAVSCGSLADLSLLVFARRKLMVVPFKNWVSQKNFCQLLSLTKSGGLLQATSVVNMFLEPTNKFLLNYFAGALAVTSYDLAMKMVWGIQSLFGAAMRVFLQLSAKGGGAVSRAFSRVVGFASVPVVLCHAVAVLVLLWVSRYWLKIDSQPLIAFFAIATVSNLGMVYITPIYIALIGQNDLRFIFRSQLILAVTNVTVSLALIPMFGLIGAAFGLLLATLYNVVAIYLRYHRTFASLEGVAETLRAGIWRYLGSILLFTVVVFLGVRERGNYLFEVLMLVSLVIVMVREPIVRELYARKRT